ncbi:MAG: hypothetical protein E7523_02240 [Ruminococcaceae bacterium]|nr:hypothetical protein [Oscillospiraceae bacterium]
MDTLLDFDTFENAETADTQLILNINAEAEQDFLAKIGGMSARKSDVAALVDQYNGTNIKTLCFAGSNRDALAIWAQRCRALGINSLLTVQAENCAGMTTSDFCTDGFLIDCRRAKDLSAVCEFAKSTDAMVYLLLPQDAHTDVLGDTLRKVLQGVILCAGESGCANVLPQVDWLSEQKDFSVFAGVGEVLCVANGKKWYPTPEIMNGIAVEVLSKGYNGLFLDGFCADIMNPDTMLYDVYENCGSLQECVGARRRHLMLVNEEKIILPGAVYHFTADICPVFKGAPVCFVLAVEGARQAESLHVLCSKTEVQYTGKPVVIARSENGKLRENHCIAGDVTCFEYYLGNDFENDKIKISVRNETKKNLILHWAEVSVNI